MVLREPGWLKAVCHLVMASSLFQSLLPSTFGFPSYVEAAQRQSRAVPEVSTLRVDAKLEAAYQQAFHVVWAVFWFVLVSLISVEAASAERAPSTIRPGGVEREFQRPPEPKASPEPLVPAIPEEVAPAEAEQIEFTLQRIEFDGATVFQDVEFRSFYEPMLDQRVTLAQIYGVADAITAKYRNAGYILSQAVVPAQKIRDGIVHLKVIEGYVADVRLEGEIKGSRSFLAAIVWPSP